MNETKKNETKREITEIELLISNINNFKENKNYSFVIRNKRTIDTIKRGLLFYKLTLLLRLLGEK